MGAEQGRGCPVASGQRQGRITAAEGVSRAERKARLCSWPGLKRLPLLLGQKFPTARCGSDAAGRQRLARSPAWKRKFAGFVPGAGRLGWRGPLLPVPHPHAPRPESLRATFSVLRNQESAKPERARYL